MIDTHCHLNFKRFKNNLQDVIERAKKVGISDFIVPGTDIETSQKAVEIAQNHAGIYAAIGIHPHHVWTDDINHIARNIKDTLSDLEKLIVHPKVVAVGEVGLDRHQYLNTKYQNYQIDSEFIKLQKELLVKQIDLAIKYKKTVILHNRESVDDILNLLTTNYLSLTTNMVFHCCEPDERLFKFAQKYRIFIGVDGDVTYWEDKQQFVKKIPLELLVLETDSPYLLPEPLRAQKLYPNEPKNIPLIAESIAKLRGESVEKIAEQTTKNAKRLFNI